MLHEILKQIYPTSFHATSFSLVSIKRLLALMIFLVGLIFFMIYTHQAWDGFFIKILFLISSAFGFACLFALTIGFINVSNPFSKDKLFHKFLDSFPHAILITDKKGHILYANDSYIQMTGISSFWKLKTIEDHFSSAPEISSLFLKIRKNLKKGKVAESDFYVPKSCSGEGDKKEKAFWYRLHAWNLSISPSRDSLYAWELYDISKEKTEWQNSCVDLEKTRKHLDHAPVGFLATNEKGEIEYLNATLASWLEIDLKNFFPKSLSISALIAKDGVALINAAKHDSSLPLTLDIDLQTNSGTLLPVHFIQSISACTPEKKTLYRSVLINLYEKNKNIKDLHSQDINFIRFFNSIPIAAAIVDKQGTIIRSNPSFLSLFFPSTENIKMQDNFSFEEVIDKNYRSKILSALQKACKGQADISPVEAVLLEDRKRHIRFCFNSFSSVSGKNGKEAIIYALDTTEQKAIETKIAQSQKMQAIGQLAGGIAHDFNNVLTAIIMSSDLLLIGHRPSDPSFPDIMNIKQNANRAASLVQQLLAFSRKQTLRTEIFNLIDILADLRMLLIRLIGPEIHLNIDHGSDLWPLKTDIGQFEQVVVNLAVNARDAMPDGGNIFIRTRNVLHTEIKKFGHRELPKEDHILIEFEDTGEGIPHHLKEMIFEPFFTTKEVGKGTGLGLSMVYGIIKQMGGFIFCTSELKKGTVFHIFLPRFVSESIETLEDQKEGVVEKNSETDSTNHIADLSGSATILLVEDEDSVRIGAVRALQSRGYKVYEASSGVEALDIFKEFQEDIDLIISDVVMPEMDGPTLLGKVRKLQPKVQFIFVSGYADDAFSKNLPPDEKFVFLPKPFSLKQLAIVVKQNLEK